MTLVSSRLAACRSRAQNLIGPIEPDGAATAVAVLALIVVTATALITTPTMAMPAGGVTLASVEGAASRTASGTTSKPSKPAQPIDINRATAEQLTAIPGIGTTIAQRIVDFRDKEGPFRRVEDLLKVKGIGEKSFQKIRPYVKVEKKT